MEAAVPAIPVNPSKPAIKAIRRNVIIQRSMGVSDMSL
jgi:hypothetical protein